VLFDGEEPSDLAHRAPVAWHAIAGLLRREDRPRVGEFNEERIPARLGPLAKAICHPAAHRPKEARRGE